MFSFPVNIFILALGVDKADIPYAVVLTGSVNVAVTIFAIVLIEKAGRRKLILVPCLVISLIYLLLTACLTVKVSKIGLDFNTSLLRYFYKNFLRCVVIGCYTLI